MRYYESVISHLDDVAKRPWRKHLSRKFHAMLNRFIFNNFSSCVGIKIMRLLAGGGTAAFALATVLAAALPAAHAQSWLQDPLGTEKKVSPAPEKR